MAQKPEQKKNRKDMRIVNLLKNQDKVSDNRKTIALSLAGISNALVNVVLQMIIARSFQKKEIAVYNQTLLIYNTVLPILLLGLTQGIYYCYVRGSGRKRAVMNEGVLISLFSSIVFSLLIAFGGNRLISTRFNNPDLVTTSLLLIPCVLVCVPESVAIVGYVLENRIRFNAVYTIIKSLVCLIFLSIASLLQTSGAVLFGARVLIQCLFGFITIISVYAYVLPRDERQISRDGILRLLKVSLPLGFAAMAGALSSNLDSWIVSSMSDPITYSVFQMGAYELPFITIITGAISTVVLVDINNAASVGDNRKVIELFRGIASKTSVFMMPIMIFFLFCAVPFIRFLYTSEFDGAVPVFMLYLLYLPVRCVLYGPLFVALGKSKIMLLREISSLILNAVLSVILVKKQGAIGATIATLIITYFYSVPVNFYLISKWCKVRWIDILPFKHMAICVLASLPGGAVAWAMNRYLLFSYSYIVQLSCGFFAFALITALAYRLALGYDLLSFVKSLLEKKKTERK